MELEKQSVLVPNIFQQEALQSLEDTDKNKGVVVMPTGTGKTFLASLWFKKQLESNPNSKLLFLCHNKDILSQANEGEFQNCLENLEINYGYYNGTEKNIQQSTFATVQTLTRNLKKFNVDDFDYIIVDEAHHYQARSFKKVLEYFKPKFLLGLTATPNRTDGKSIYKICGEKIYEAKINDAIKKGLLTKINYWCVDNDIDFSDVKWNGNRYDEKDLNRKICVKEYDDAILEEYQETLRNKFNKMKTICFCATVEHVHRMAKLFNNNGISAVGLTGRHRLLEDKVPRGERGNIIKGFREGKYDIIFVRDLFNEGVDIPDCDSIMMLRPTQSHTIFTQQIGRGLRKAEGKEEVLILDFTGNAKKCIINLEVLGEIINKDIIKEIKKESFDKDAFEIELINLGYKVRLSKKKFEYIKNIKKNINKEDIVKCFYKLKKKLGRVPLKRDIINDLGISNLDYTLLLSMLGESREGLIRPTKEDIIDTYWTIKKGLGRQPKAIEIYHGYYFPKYWDSYQNFLTKIGEPIRLSTKDVSKKEIKEEYFRMKIKLGRQPIQKDFSERRKSGAIIGLRKIEKIFGKWTNLLIDLGEPLNQNNIFARDVTKKELIDNFYNLKRKKRGLVVSTDMRIKKGSKFGINKYSSKFGSWINFLKSIDEPYRQLYIPKEYLINELKSMAIKLGHPPSRKEFGNRAITLSQHYNNGWEEVIKEVFGDKTKERVCPICTKDFSYSISAYPKNVGKLNCSMKCRDVYLNQKIVGDNGRRIINEYNKGRDAQSIARDIGISRNVLTTYFKFNGIKIRNRKESREAIKLYNELKSNIKITSKYKPKTILPIKKIKRSGNKKAYGGLKKEDYKSKEDKVDIRDKIISKINDGDNVLLLESPELLALKEIEKKRIKPNKIIIPNHLEFKKISEALKNYKTNLNIELINTSALQYLVDSEEKFDFIWLDYCGAFSYYMKDLDILFAKKFEKMKLILTYNLFDPIKDDDNYYFTRTIDYVLDKVSGKSKVRLINDVTYRYKKNMYNLGFQISTP